MSDVKIFSSNKILKHLDRVLPWLKGENVYPITVEIDLTDRCNNKCPGCVGGRTGSEDLKNPFLIIDQLVEAGVKALTFTGGGEPMLHKQVLETVEYAKKKGLDVGFISNGLALTPEACRIIVKNCVWTRISLDASNPKEYKITHGLDSISFNKTIDKIRMLVNAKKRTKSNCTIGVGYLTKKELLEGMLPATKLCKKLRVDYIQFRPFHWDTTPIDKQLKKCKKLETKSFMVLYSKHKYDSMTEPDLGRSYKICYGHQVTSVVCANGDMTICCHTRGDKKFVIGNLYKNSFKEIWNSEQRQKAIKRIDLKKCIPFCRCDTFNQVLWNLKQPTEHENFL